MIASKWWPVFFSFVVHFFPATATALRESTSDISDANFSPHLSSEPIVIDDTATTVIVYSTVVEQTPRAASPISVNTALNSDNGASASSPLDEDNIPRSLSIPTSISVLGPGLSIAEFPTLSTIISFPRVTTSDSELDSALLSTSVSVLGPGMSIAEFPASVSVLGPGMSIAEFPRSSTAVSLPRPSAISSISSAMALSTISVGFLTTNVATPHPSLSPPQPTSSSTSSSRSLNNLPTSTAPSSKSSTSSHPSSMPSVSSLLPPSSSRAPSGASTLVTSTSPTPQPMSTAAVAIQSPAQTTSHTSSTTTQAIPPSTSTSGTPATILGHDSTAQHSGLSKSTAVGIGVGVGLAVLALLAILTIWCCCIRRKDHKGTYTSANDAEKAAGIGRRGRSKRRAPWRRRNRGLSGTVLLAVPYESVNQRRTSSTERASVEAAAAAEPGLLTVPPQPSISSLGSLRPDGSPKRSISPGTPSRYSPNLPGFLKSKRSVEQPRVYPELALLYDAPTRVSISPNRRPAEGMLERENFHGDTPPLLLLALPQRDSFWNTDSSSESLPPAGGPALRSTEITEFAGNAATPLGIQNLTQPQQSHVQPPLAAPISPLQQRRNLPHVQFSPEITQQSHLQQHSRPQSQHPSSLTMTSPRTPMTAITTMTMNTVSPLESRRSLSVSNTRNMGNLWTTATGKGKARAGYDYPPIATRNNANGGDGSSDEEEEASGVTWAVVERSPPLQQSSQFSSTLAPAPGLKAGLPAPPPQSHTAAHDARHQPSQQSISSIATTATTIPTLPPLTARASTERNTNPNLNLKPITSSTLANRWSDPDPIAFDFSYDPEVAQIESEGTKVGRVESEKGERGFVLGRWRGLPRIGL